jgi:transcriptional regulator with XRE-family HTH domain
MTTQAMDSARWVPDTRAFGARLALVRQHMGWNQKEAALACGLKPSSWREWEMRGRGPHNLQDVAELISERTNCDDYWLLTGKTHESPHPTVPDGGVNDAASTRRAPNASRSS